MSFLRVSNPNAVAFDLPDLGITVGASASNIVLSNQFSVNDLYLSADLEAAVIAGSLTIQIDYGTGFASVAAVDYTNRDALSAFLNVYELTNENNNEKLVDGSEVDAAGPASAPLHIHDARYFSKAELGSVVLGSSGAGLIGVNDDAWDTEWPFTFTTVQGFIDGLEPILAGIAGSVDLDSAYTNDADGIMNVNGTTKPLDLRSDNVNDIQISRKLLTDIQNALIFDVSANELLLGAAVVGALAEVNVRVPTNMTVDGNLTITGTLTDTTVNTLNVTNANIRLRDGATAIAAADAYIEVERGSTGADSQLLWNETLDRWQGGLVGDLGTIGMINWNEVVTGIWEFQGAAAADPSMYLTNKAAAPSTNLGSASQIPLAMVNNVPGYEDKTNSRNKFLSMYRRYFDFSGRDSSNNKDEYMRAGIFTSNQSSYRCIKPMTLIGMAANFENSATANIRVRKNGSATNLATLAVAAATGAQAQTYNIDFAAGDVVQVFLDSAGVHISRPFVSLELAEKL